MRVGIAADHGGFALKEHMMNFLRRKGYDLVDFGATSLHDDDDYPDFVIPLARAVAAGEVVRGVAICGSGVGGLHRGQQDCRSKGWPDSRRLFRPSGRGRRQHECALPGRTGHWIRLGRGVGAKVSRRAFQRCESPSPPSGQGDRPGESAVIRVKIFEVKGNESSASNLSGGGFHCFIRGHFRRVGFALVAAASDAHGRGHARCGRHRLLQHDASIVETSLERAPFRKNLAEPIGGIPWNPPNGFQFEQRSPATKRFPRCGNFPRCRGDCI